MRTQMNWKDESDVLFEARNCIEEAEDWMREEGIDPGALLIELAKARALVSIATSLEMRRGR